MKNKEYSKINKIPVGNATDNITEGCIVLEGGAFRGIYVAAVLDALMENGINLSCAIGVSAGALNGMNYISGQIGRAGIITLKHRFDKKYVGFNVFLKTRSIMGYEYMFDDIMEKYPFNHKRFKNNEQRFVMVTTNIENGKAVYFEKNHPELYKILQASSSLPYISKPVEIDGTYHLDGGCSDKVPYQWAIDEGFKKIIVINTQQKGYRKPETSNRSKNLAKRFYKNYPNFANALSFNNEMYNAQLDGLDKLNNDGEILVLSPSKSVEVSRFEKDIEKIGDLYFLGYNDTLKRIDEIKRYLKA